MTRLLYWNIENFARNKIDDRSMKRKKPGSSLNDHEKSVDRKDHILWLIREVNPDIFILVEVETAFRGVGQLVKGDGRDGVIKLLDHMRNELNHDWMLVPPLQTGHNEAVAIFYRSTNRHFTGPYVWPGGHAAVPQQHGAGVVPANYPARYVNFLPNRDIPDAAHDNPKLHEYQVAARIDFTYRAGHANAGAPVDFQGHRAPYMATFFETGALVRNLTLFAIHAPATANTARTYLRSLADYAEIVDGQAANEVRIVVGDFNWNLLDDANNYAEHNSYGLLHARNYDLVLRPLNPLPAGPLQGYRTYFATHIEPTTSAIYWSTNQRTVYYPGYAYISDDFYAIDNIFTRYGAVSGGPAANFTIINPIVGCPYNLHPVPFALTPQGTTILPIDMPPHIGVLNNPPLQGPNYNIGLMTKFQGWEQYGHIRSVSDHLALAIDI